MGRNTRESPRQHLVRDRAPRLGAAGNMMAMHDTQQNRASATSRRPPMRQRNRWNGAALRRYASSCRAFSSQGSPGGLTPCERCIFRRQTRRGRGERMKIVEIVPRARAHLYGTLVAKEAAIRKSGRGTYVRVGRKSQRAARWKHKKFKGTLALTRGDSDAVTAKVRATTPEDERKLLSS